MRETIVEFLHELRRAARASRTATFTASVVLTFAVGIGAVVTVISVVDGVLVKATHFADVDSLYVVQESLRAPGGSVPEVPVSAAHAEEWRRSVRSFSDVAIISPRSATLTGRGEPMRIGTARVSGSVIPMLGLRAQSGRLILARFATVRHTRSTGMTLMRCEMWG